MSYRFLLDENIPRSIYRMLRRKGFHAEYVPHGVDDDRDEDSQGEGPGARDQG